MARAAAAAKAARWRAGRVDAAADAVRPRSGGTGTRRTIVSPHAARRLYAGGHRLFRSDDRGDSWTPVSPDLTRALDASKLEIMGKVWPTDSVAFNQATTTLSTITTLDESPLLEGLLYVGTDDGLIQVSEDGGKNWRKVDQIPGVPQYTYVTDLFASVRDPNTVFATLNNYQRGDYKPYIVKSTDRGRTWTSIAGNLPQRAGAWSIVQDHVNANLLFAGMEFGVYFTVDGGARWTSCAAAFPVSRRAISHPAARERSRRRYVRPRRLHPRRLLAAASDGREDAGRRGAAVPAAGCVRRRRARTGARGVGQRDDAKSAVRRGLHLLRRAGAGRRCEAGA